ncbi:hypothetical protein TNCT_139171 [Trichonephila clavata]|uniref:Uncharacterized protein n=1 Tax=Trichonephila clavata TaxID=2740835 RepID=A0A8X6H3Q0_TRICU|nr:hypothetical protein TNCT_139171 [Trichonephila clavata]
MEAKYYLLKYALEAICNGDTNPAQSINILLGQINERSILQWIPAHIDIGGIECGDVLTKVAWDLDQPSTLSLEDKNSVARCKISHTRFIKPAIPETNCLRNFSSTAAIFRTSYYKGRYENISR